MESIGESIPNEEMIIKVATSENMDDSFGARVRSVLVELLPIGCSSIEEVSLKLGVSKRTLQRKLTEEKTTFKKQLNYTRELLSKNYIKSSD